MTDGSREKENIEGDTCKYNKSNTELMDEIETILNSDDIDVEKIKRNLIILQNSAPITNNYDPIVEWNMLMENHPLLFKTDKNLKRKRAKKNSNKSKNMPLRLIRLFEVLIIIMFCLVITVNAFGYNPISSFVTWAKDVLQINSNFSGQMQLPIGETNDYLSLTDALDKNGVNSSNCPNWIPNDYIISSVDVVIFDYMKQFSSIYESERGELLIRVLYFDNHKWTGMEEYENGGEIYTKNDVNYYILTNSDIIKSVWQYDDLYYTISGQISETELKQIIDSIS